MIKRIFFLLLVIVFSCYLFKPLFAQEISVIRYTPGFVKNDKRHKIELFNSGNSVTDISGYVLITRDYIVKIPKGTFIGSKEIFTIAYGKETKSKSLDLLNCQTLFNRIYSKKVEGNYFILYNNKMKILDAFYYSFLRDVPFLPDSGFFALNEKDFLSFYIPSGNAKVWAYYSIGDDPAISFIRQNNQWQITSINRYSKLNPPAKFGEFTGRFNEGQIILKWSTTEENNCKRFIIEKSYDLEKFVLLDQVEPAVNSKTRKTYTYYCLPVKKGETAFYRISAEDIFGNQGTSKPVEIKASEIPVEFSIDVLPDDKQGIIKFYSAYSQKTTIKLLSGTMKTLYTLFDDMVNAESENLIRITKVLEAGKYYVVAETEGKRFWKPMEVQP